MRKLAILSAALFGLSIGQSAMAQSEAAPQPGLPPGFSNGSPNAQPPNSTGDVTNTQVGPSVRAPRPVATGPTPAQQRRQARLASRRAARAARAARQAAPAADSQ